MIRAVLFDFDGTVADTNELIKESFRHVFDTYKINDISDDVIYSFFGEPLFETLGRYCSDGEVDNLVSVYRDYNLKNHDEKIALFPNVRETLQELKNRGLFLGIVTSKMHGTVERGLRLLDIINFFDVVVTPEDTIKHKPDKEPVVYALRKLGVTKDEALMVGDSQYDIQSGNGAGTKTVAVNYSRIKKEILTSANPTYFVDDLSELIGIVDTLNKALWRSHNK